MTASPASTADLDPDTVDWDDVSFLLSSLYCTNVLQTAAARTATPSEIAEHDIAPAHVSRALSQLRVDDLVQLLVTEDRRKHRVHGMTERGEQVWHALIQFDLTK